MIQLLEECGYNGYKYRSNNNGWHILTATNYEVVNHHLVFVIAMNPNGLVWLSKSRNHKDFKINVHNPDSLTILKEELILIKEQHRAAYSRQG